MARKIIRMQRSFFWYSNNNQKGIPLIVWEAILAPKEFRGLGVGDLIVKNAALLFKWWWHFNDCGDLLWKRIIQSNHYTQLGGQRSSATDLKTSSLWNQLTDLSNLREFIQGTT